MDELKSKVILASKWSTIAELSSKFISPIVFIVLARLLTPKDYGVAAAAATVIGLSQIIWDAGLSQALIQRKKELQEYANVVFWTNVLLSVVVYIILFLSANLIAQLFKDSRVENVLKIQALGVIISAISSVQTAIFRKNLDFKTLFWTRIATLGIPALASIPLAYLGAGYWALVMGNLLGTVAQTISLWKLSSWRPKYSYSIEIAKDLLSFGSWVVLEGILVWFFAWGDSIVVGAYLSTHELGLYRTGSNFIYTIFGLVLSPVLPVLYSMFAQMGNDKKILAQTLMKINKVIAFLAFPIGITLFLLQIPITSIVFGAKWQGVGPVIGILGLLNGFSWYWGANTQVYKAMGKPDISTKLLIIHLIYYIPTYFLAIQKGLLFFLWARLFIEVISMLIHAYYSKKMLEIRIIDFFKNLNDVLIIILPLTAFYLLIKNFFQLNLFGELLIYSIVIILYSFIVYYTKDYVRKFVNQFLSTFIKLKPATK